MSPVPKSRKHVRKLAIGAALLSVLGTGGVGGSLFNEWVNTHDASIRNGMEIREVKKDVAEIKTEVNEHGRKLDLIMNYFGIRSRLTAAKNEMGPHLDQEKP